MTISDADKEEGELWVRSWMPSFFLLDVGIMFLGMILFGIGAWWAWVILQLLACSFTLFVIYVAVVAKRFIPRSIPLQFETGVVFLIFCRIIQIVCPPNMADFVFVFLIVGSSLSMVFLFDHLLEDAKE